MTNGAALNDEICNADSEMFESMGGGYRMNGSVAPISGLRFT